MIVFCKYKYSKWTYVKHVVVENVNKAKKAIIYINILILLCVRKHTGDVFAHNNFIYTPGANK